MPLQVKRVKTPPSTGIYNRLRSISTYYILWTSPHKAKHVVKYDSGVRGAADVFERVGARGQVCVCEEVVGVGVEYYVLVSMEYGM